MNDLNSTSSSPSTIYSNNSNNSNNIIYHDEGNSSSSSTYITPPPLRESFQNEIFYETEGPFKESIPILKKRKEKEDVLSLPLTKFRGLLVILLVSIFLILSTSYFLFYRFLQESEIIYTMFLILRPLVLVPLIIIIPFYGVNNRKTLKYSIFIAMALFLNIIGDIIISFEFSLSNSTNGALFDQVFHIFSLIFYMLSRLFYCIAFIIGIGKRMKLRLLHAIPFYTYAATLVLLMMFSKQIAPIIIKPANQTIINISSDNSAIDSSGSDYHDPFNRTEMSLIVIYAFIEATLMWRSVSLTSSLYLADPGKLLLWLGVVGATVFGITDTLTVISFYYYPLKGIFYYNTGGIWLGHALILFSTPRRMEVRDYIYKILKMNKSTSVFKNSKSLLINHEVKIPQGIK